MNTAEAKYSKRLFAAPPAPAVTSYQLLCQLLFPLRLFPFVADVRPSFLWFPISCKSRVCKPSTCVCKPFKRSVNVYIMSAIINIIFTHITFTKIFRNFYLGTVTQILFIISKNNKLEPRGGTLTRRRGQDGRWLRWTVNIHLVISK